MKVHAVVDISDDPSGYIEGHFITPEAGQIQLTPTDGLCPFCFGSFQVASAPRLGRIGQEFGKRSVKEAVAIVELLPQTHEALKCSRCDMVMTRLRERDAGAGTAGQTE